MATKAVELLTQIKDILLISGSTQDPNIIRAMNLVQKQIYNSHYHWRDLEAVTSLVTVASTATVDIPVTTGIIYDVTQTSTSPYGKLTYISPRKFHAIIPQPTQFATNKPIWYTWWGGKLYLYPIPDAVYTLTLYTYNKPLNMKLYATGTASNNGASTTVTGSGTKFKTAANVDTSMFFAYQSDIKSDSTYPWSTIATIAADTTMTISAYAGAGGQAAAEAYYTSSECSYSNDFDLALVYGTAILMSGKMQDQSDTMKWLIQQYDAQIIFLAQTQTSIPDYKPILEDFYVVSRDRGLGDSAYKFPFIRSDI
jgi:hypothetical protein